MTNDLKNFLEDPINKEYLGIYKKQVQLKYHNEVLDLVEKEVKKLSVEEVIDENTVRTHPFLVKKNDISTIINNLRV